MIFRKIALLLALPGALALSGTAEATYFTNSNAVAVYQFNVNQMTNNWPGWITSIQNESNGPVPDVILGQDFESLGEVAEFVSTISGSSGFSTNYTYVASNISGNVTNRRVVIWRTDRFNLLRYEAWAGHGGDPDVASCTLGADNAQAIQVQLQDRLNTTNIVSAVSMKTPPKGTFNECAWRNMQLATQQLARPLYAGTLHLVGTDTNAPDWNGSAYNCWYRGTIHADNTTCNGTDLGWSDVIYDNCGGLRSCLDGHWTHAPSSRIDYVFAKRGATIGANSTDRRTIDKFACVNYSNHCSVRAVISYGASF